MYKGKSENLYSIMEDSSIVERNRVEFDNRAVVLSVDEITVPIDSSTDFPPPPPPAEEIVAIVTKKEPKVAIGNMVAYNALPEMLDHVNN